MIELLKKILERHFTEKVKHDYIDKLRKMSLTEEERKELISNLHSVINYRSRDIIVNFVKDVIETDSEIDDEVGDFIHNKTE